MKGKGDNEETTPGNGTKAPRGRQRGRGDNHAHGPDNANPGKRINAQTDPTDSRLNITRHLVNNQAISQGVLAMVSQRSGSSSTSLPRNLAPRIGRGEVRFRGSDGTQIDQGCAASSVAQLLSAEYGREFKNDIAVWLATTVQRISGTPNGTPLDISDVWWQILLCLLPNGPWPGLIVLYMEDGAVLGNRTCLYRIPGPPDRRTLCVIGDGRHFDPIWWELPTGIFASPPVEYSFSADILPTLTPNMGPAAGALFLCHAEYAGHIPFDLDPQHEFSREHAELTMQGNGDWTRWTRHWNSYNDSGADTNNNYAAISLLCAHPDPSSPPSSHTDLGHNILVAATQTLRTPDEHTAGRLAIIAFDNAGCHIGKIADSTANGAPTWLQQAMASAVPKGHRWS